MMGTANDGMGKNRTGGKGKLGQHSSDDEIAQFCQIWGIDPASQQMLSQAPLEVAQLTMQTFAPKADTRNVSGLLVSFLKKQYENLGMPAPSSGVGSDGSTAGMGSDGGMSGAGSDDISNFIQQWGLDAGCETILRQASPETALAAMSKFSP